MADYSDPKRGVAFRWNICLIAQSGGQIKTTPTIAAGDFKISKDNGATANLTTLPSEAPAGSGNVQLDISATEMTADLVKVIWIDAAGAEWNSGSMTLGTSSVQMADLATAAALTVVDDFLDTEIAAIKAKTDLIPAAPAAVGDIPTAAAIADAVWDEDATAHQTQGTFGQAIGDPAADTDSIWALVNTNLDAAVSTRLPTSSYTSPLSSAGTRGALGMASANLDTQIATLATAANLATVAGYLDTEIAAILADTNELQADWADGGRLDLLIDAINAKTTNLPSDPADASVIAGRFDTLDTSVADLPTNAELATALGDIPSAAAIADAVWDEALAGHAGAGSTGEQLAAAGAAGDPWATALPGAYSAGSAGKIVGDALDAAVSTRASQATLDTLDGVADAIKVKTDSLTFTVAGQVDANIQYVNDVQVTGTGASGDEWGP